MKKLKELKNKKTLAVVATCVAVGVAATAMMGMMGAPGGGGPGGMGMEDETNQRTVVEAQNPTIGNIVVTSTFVGTVEPGQQVTVYPKASGEVTSVYFNVGDTVEAGDVLFELDSTTLQYTIAQTQASLSSAQAKANLNLQIAQQDLETYESNVVDGYNSSVLSAESSVANAENQVQQASNNLRTARKNYNDAKNGDDDEYYTDSQIDSLRQAKVAAELTLESAQLGLEQAKANLEAVKKQVEDQSVSASNGVAQAQLNANLSDQYIGLQQLQDNLKDYTVTSPISGVVEQRNVDQYDMASSQLAAYVISNKEALTVSFNVTESSLAYMKTGDAITLEKNGETCTGTISEISTMVSSTSGLYTVKATVENPPFEMHSGSTIKLYADTQKVENEIMVPIDAVYYDNGNPYVYVFKDQSAVKTFIETGISDDTNIQVVSGLSLSDNVIVTWSSNLFDGAEVYLPGTEPADDGEEMSGDTLSANSLNDSAQPVEDQQTDDEMDAGFDGELETDDLDSDEDVDSAQDEAADAAIDSTPEVQYQAPAATQQVEEPAIEPEAEEAQLVDNDTEDQQEPAEETSRLRGF